MVLLAPVPASSQPVPPFPPPARRGSGGGGMVLLALLSIRHYLCGYERKKPLSHRLNWVASNFRESITISLRLLLRARGSLVCVYTAQAAVFIRTYVILSNRYVQEQVSQRDGRKPLRA